MITSAIVFDHRGRAKGEGPLEVRVTADRHPYYINTGIKCCKNEWKFGRIINRSDANELNKRLDLIARAVESEVTRCLTEHVPVNVAEIKRKVWDVNGRNDEETFLDWADSQIPNLGLAAGTLKHYRTTLARMRECAIIIRWNDLTVENVLEFDRWLHKLKVPMSDADRKRGVIERCISDSGVYTYHKNLMGLISRAIKMGKVENSPYERLKGEFRRGVKENVEYLTEDEVTAFVNLHPEEGTMDAVARDLFVFQLYTGLSYSDAQAFDIRNYKKVDGRWISIGERIKTGVPFVSQLLPPVVEVLERYNWQVPKIHNGEYNQCLKSLGREAGIQTRLHSHLARHTFATLMLKSGAKIENVSKMLGHTKITQTMVYAKVLAQSVHDDFNNMERYLTLKQKMI